MLLPCSGSSDPRIVSIDWRTQQKKKKLNKLKTANLKSININKNKFVPAYIINIAL